MADSVYDFPLKTIDGQPLSLAAYAGKVLLLVNVASECGFTSQYTSLQELYETYRERGFVLIGFPANEFGGQEPGTNQQIKNFCTTRFAVTFPMSEKIVVKGESRDPLYAYLTEQAGEVTWNFNKFLVDRSGKVVCRFDSKVEPLDPKLTKAIEAALG